MSTHGNGYDDVDIRDAINRGEIDGPRAQVSTRGIVWGGVNSTAPSNPLVSAIVNTAEEARALYATRSNTARIGSSYSQRAVIPSPRMGT